MIRAILLFLGLVLGNVSMAMVVSVENKIVTVAPYTMSDFDGVINDFLGQKQADKLFEATRFFLDKPYLLEPLGEGPTGDFSQEPMYRTDQFDCVTYVDTVLALYHAHHLGDFQQNMLHVRYIDGRIQYTSRTEWFTDLEWIPTIQRLGWLKDVTSTVTDLEGQPIFKMAETVIDKPNWYRVRPLKMIHRLQPIPDEAAAESLLQKLHAEATRFVPETSRLSYLPLDRLFDRNHHPIEHYFDQIPSGSVVIIVRPNWAIRDHFPNFPEGYGTNLNVSHLGVVFRTADGLMFYNASSLHGKVVVEPLVTYLEKYIDSPTIKGIHIEQVV